MKVDNVRLGKKKGKVSILSQLLYYLVSISNEKCPMVEEGVKWLAVVLPSLSCCLSVSQ